jgi:hypothetical protein
MCDWYSSAKVFPLFGDHFNIETLRLRRFDADMHLSEELLTLGQRYAEGVICGSNARCIAMLTTLDQVSAGLRLSCCLCYTHRAFALLLY